MKEESERHRHWNKINLKAKVFDNVRPLTGNRKILYDIGYTKDITNESDETTGIAFPDKDKPYEPKVRELAIDLCIAKYELRLMEYKTHPKLTDLKDIDEIPSSFFVDNDSIGSITQSMEPNNASYLLLSSSKKTLDQAMYPDTNTKKTPMFQKRIMSYEESNDEEEKPTVLRKGFYLF